MITFGTTNISKNGVRKMEAISSSNIFPVYYITKYVPHQQHTNEKRLNNEKSKGGNFDPLTYEWADSGCYVTSLMGKNR